MYSLDINFLNDRSEYKPDTASRSRVRTGSTDSKRPLILGALAAVLLPGIALGMLLYLQSRNAQLEQDSAALDAQLGDLAAKQKQIEGINAQAAQVKSETTALATVFNQIKPLSALMQELRDRTPPNVQLTEVTQLPPDKAAAPQPAASPPANGAAPPPPQGIIQISGRAKSFNDVNDLILVLQKSNFLNPKQTQLVNSELVDAPGIQNLQLKNAPQAASNGDRPAIKLPKEVKFQIQSALSDVPASTLLRELDRKGATGLVTRIEALQQKGVIQP